MINRKIKPYQNIKGVLKNSNSAHLFSMIM